MSLALTIASGLSFFFLSYSFFFSFAIVFCPLLVYSNYVVDVVLWL